MVPKERKKFKRREEASQRKRKKVIGGRQRFTFWNGRYWKKEKVPEDGGVMVLGIVVPEGGVSVSEDGETFLDGIPLDKVDWNNYWGIQFSCLPCSEKGVCIFFPDKNSLQSHVRDYHCKGRQNHHLLPKKFGSHNIDCPLCHNTFADEQALDRHLPKCSHYSDCRTHLREETSQLVLVGRTLNLEIIWILPWL